MNDHINRLMEILHPQETGLDFGIYRLMDLRRKHIEEFLKRSNPQESIYRHLIDFFSRYYERGNLTGGQRYIPTDGQREIVFHWKSRGRYYVKTTEYFRRYTFRIQETGLVVNFRLSKVEEEKGNAKSREKKYFILSEKKFHLNTQENTLDIYFEYRRLTKEEKGRVGRRDIQKRLNRIAIETLRREIPENSPARSIFQIPIEKHLSNYTRRITTDYFIHRNLKEFLEREREFYMGERLPTPEDSFREVSQGIIDILFRVEEIQRKMWEKKKFVLETHYVITLGKIEEYAGEEFLRSIEENLLRNEEQRREWKEILGIEVRSKEDLRRWKHLPIDTRHFDEEFEWNLLSALKRPIEEILDGILIKSENFQALNLLMNRFGEKVRTIYIDPPFNKESESQYLYKVGYRTSAWITMLENRIRLSRELLNKRGSIFVRCDYTGNAYVRLLMDEIFGRENFRNEIIVRRGAPKAGLLTQFDGIRSMAVGYDNLYWYSKSPDIRFKGFYKLAPREKREKGFWADFRKGEFYDRPTMRYPILGISIDKGQWKWGKERAYRAVENYRRYLEVSKETGESLEQYWRRTGKALEFIKREGDKIKYWVPPREYLMIDNNWMDIPGYSSTTRFQTENSEILLKRIIESTSEKGEWVMDFFLGSGTTTAVAHKLKRRWIGVEMGEHFYSVILPRMKRVLFYDKSGISKERDVREIYNAQNAGGFFKYHILEQYEDALENLQYRYILQWEKEKILLDKEGFDDPLRYSLKVVEEYSIRERRVDPVETFNYLSGLEIIGYRTMRDGDRRYLFVLGRKGDRRVAIVWRSVEKIDWERDKDFIEETLRDFHPHIIYANRHATVENFEQIEKVMERLMMEGMDYET